MNNMQLWLISSTDSINLNSAADGYYLNPDLDGLTGLPGIRSSNGVNAGYDGGWTSTQLWDARLITIRGLIVDKDGSQVELKRKALSKLVGQGKKEPLTLKFVTEFGRTYTCTVRTTNCTMALQNIFTRQEYQIQLRADDPLIYDDGGNDVKATLRVTEDNVGFEIPFDIPLDISGGADPVVVDAGEDTNYPLITMYGELHSPTIVNQTTNQQLQLGADLNGLTRDWNETDTASGNPLQITNSTEYDAPILDFKLNGNTEQTTYTGKNKLDPSILPSSWTQTSPVYITLTGLKPNTSYTCSTNMPLNSGGYADILFINTGEAASSSTAGVWSGHPITKTTDGTGNNIQIMYRSYLGTPINRDNYTYQIEEGSTPTAYEPYVGGIASPNPDYPQAVNVVTGEQVVKVNGQNLIELKPYYFGYFYGNAVGTAINYDITTNADKVSYTVNADGTSSVTATASWRGVILMSDALTTGTYYFNVNGVSTTANQGASVYVLDGNHIITRQIVNLTGNPITNQLKMSITLTGNERYIALGVGCRTTAGTINLGTFMISVGSSPVPYEKYRGENYEVNLGKNLFDYTTITNVQNGTNNGDGTITSNTWSSATWQGITTIFNAISISEPFTISMDIKLSSGSTGTLSKINDGVSNFTSVSSPAVSTTWQKYVYKYTPTSGYSIAKFYVQFSAINGSFEIKNIQIERGTQATSFASYFAPIELCKIGTYQDYIWNDNGTWKVHKAVGKTVLNGSENWLSGQTLTNTTHFNIGDFTTVFDGIKVPTDDTQLGLCMSDYFIEKANLYNIDQVGIDLHQNKNLIVGVQNSIATTVANFKTWLGTHNTTVYYVLATATDTAITESALITQLNAIVQASLPVGLNNVSNISIAPNLAGEMVLTYGTGYVETPPDVAVIDCKDRTVSINGVNAFNLLADGSEFIRLEPGENKLYLTSETQSDSGYAEVKFKTGNLSI